MKAIKTIIVLFVFICSSYAQTDCKPYVPTKKGTIWELTNYNAKGKVEGRIQYEVIDRVVNGNDITFKINTKTFDKKGEQIFTSSFEAKCVNGVFDIDMAFKMDGSQFQAYEDVDVKVDASQYQIPDLDAAVGTLLADGSLKVSVVVAGGININMTVLITDRKVEARENKETPAGTFDCIVLSQKVSTKMLLKVQGASKEWYAENLGLVRSESYNKKGKLLGYSEITKLIL